MKSYRPPNMHMQHISISIPFEKNPSMSCASVYVSGNFIIQCNRAPKQDGKAAAHGELAKHFPTSYNIHTTSFIVKAT